jgi:hypothetical protein
MSYKILERKGVFIVGEMVMKKRWIFGKSREEFNVLWKAPYEPAHFDTIEEAKEYIKLIQKPDIYHSV